MVEPGTASRLADGVSSQNGPGFPVLQAHYAAMHAQEEVLKRQIPEALVLYHIQLKLTHSGETAESMLKMKDGKFGTLFAQCLQITCDPGLVPYERDGTLRVVCQLQGLAALLPYKSDGALPRTAFKNRLLFRTEIEDTENIVSLPRASLSLLCVN